MNYLVIKCSNMTLVIPENDLKKALPQSMLIQGLQKGKGYLRAKQTERRNNSGFDRWQLYEVLKGNRIIDNTTFEAIECLSAVELREGVIEFLYSQSKRCQNGG